MPASRKLYRDIADEIRRIYDFAEESDKFMIRHVTRTLAGSLKRDNIHFNRQKFLSVALGDEWSND